GRSAGGHPATQALIAACRALTARARPGSKRSTPSARHGPPASIRSTSAAGGGTTGRPSVHSWAKHASTACQGSSTSRPGWGSSFMAGSRWASVEPTDVSPQEGCALLVEPHLLHAAPTVDRMVRDEVLHVRPRREVVESPDEHRPHGRLFQSPLDLVHQRHAFLRIQLLGLLVDEPRDRLVAEAGIVS